MKTNLFLIYTLCCLLVGCGGGEEEALFTPDHLWHAPDGNSLLVANRAGCELLRFQSDLKTVNSRITLASPVNDLVLGNDNRLWVVCDGAKGSLYELDATNLSILSQTQLGYAPSAVVLNALTHTLWIPQRFNNELWEVNPDSKAVLRKIPVGREPVAIVSFAGDSLLLVANNLPETAATTYPVACRLDVVDVLAGQVLTQLSLPNGSTDVKAIATDAARTYAYVTHLVARYQLPTGQVDRGWMSTNALSIINLQTREVETTVLLDTPQKGAANPWAVSVSPDDSQLCVALSGSHEVASIDRLALHDRLVRMRNGERVTPSSDEWKDMVNDAGFLYGIRQFIATDGKGPRAVLLTPERVYTANYYTGELISMNYSGTDKIQQAPGLALVTTSVGKGEMYFHDATLSYQSWQSCASCHPNDARVDGLNWDLLNDGMGNPKNTKTMLVAHQTAPCMITGIRKDAETAVRSGIRYILFSKTDEAVSQAIDCYLKALVPLPSPYLIDELLSEAATRGKVSFDNHCASCHNGTLYTDRKQYNVDWATGSEAVKKMDVPALIEVWRTAPYLYDGRSYTIHEMLNVHGPKEQLPEAELNDLTEYVLSL